MDLSTRQGRREQGQRIQKAVERAGLSVEELANRIGCSRALIYQYLSGTTLAQPDRLQQIAAETGVSLVAFYAEDGSEEEREGRRPSERDDPRNRLTERIQQLEELAQAQEMPPDWDALVSTCERIVSLASQMDDTPTEARALLRQGKARIHLGESSRAVESLLRAADLFSGLEDTAREADARQALGNALLAVGRMSEARTQFERVARSEHLAARWTGAVSLAAVYEQLGDYRQAMEHCDEAAILLEESGHVQEAARGMLYVNANRVNLYMACGDFLSAEQLAQRCLEDAEGQGSSDQYMEARLNLGFCALALGRWSLAHRTLAAVAQLARFLNDRSREALSRGILALSLSALGDYDSAIQQAKDALASAFSLGDRRAELFAQMALADAYSNAGRDVEARYHANQTFAVASALRLALYEAEARLRLARLCLRSSELQEAAEYIERAMNAAQRLGARHLETQAYLLRGEFLLEAGESAEAQAAIEAGAARAQELQLLPEQWRAQVLRARVLANAASPNRAQALEAIHQAVSMLEGLRNQVREAGMTDTILEDRERQDIYLLCARWMKAEGRAEEAAAFIEQAGWLPLAARLAAEE
jgi:tetratricopeptide (TPR) repeat protein